MRITHKLQKDGGGRKAMRVDEPEQTTTSQRLFFRNGKGDLVRLQIGSTYSITTGPGSETRVGKLSAPYPYADKLHLKERDKVCHIDKVQISRIQVRIMIVGFG